MPAGVKFSVTETMHLVLALARRDLKLAYRDRAFGILWAVLEPLLKTGVYVFLIGVVLDRGSPEFAFLVLACLISWTWFAFSLRTALGSVVGQATLLHAVRFPVLVLPLSKVVVGLVRFLLGVGVLVGLLLVLGPRLSLQLLWLPGLVVVQLLLTAGTALLVASVGVFFRDLENLLGSGLRIGFYLSPGLYDLADVPTPIRPLYLANPFTGLFEGYKNVLVHGTAPPLTVLGSLLAGVAVAIGGITLFRRRSPAILKAL